MTIDRDAVVIGGGFYGVAIAVYLARKRGMERITLVEKNPRLLGQASFNNQARVHNGYHYPRNFTTAYRSRENLPKFLHDWPAAVKKDFTKLYAIARKNSKVTAKQFIRFREEIGSKTKPCEPRLERLFDDRLIEAVFEVEEYAFDARVLESWAENNLIDTGVEIRLLSSVTQVSKRPNQGLVVNIKTTTGEIHSLSTRYVFNCTYSGLNQISDGFPGTRTQLKHEIAEMALLEVPDILNELGITVMDGPFFSLMPFPAKGLHTLSHVRYTPHLSWKDRPGINPYGVLESCDHISRANRMIRDAGRYLPSIFNSKYKESLFEVKTVLEKNEGDDGRPILYEKHQELPGCFSILGGKIDNIYDVLEKLDAESLLVAREYANET